MKKLILLLLLGGFALTSCQKEDLSSEMELNALESKAKTNDNAKEDSCNEDDKCETAFGRKCLCPSENTCFSDLGMASSNRWGWSVYLNDGLDKNYNFDLYAGAGQCDYLEKGTEVGSVKVTVDNDGNVSYEVLEMKSGYSIKEFHFYAGETQLPMKKNGKWTVAPGQYYNEGDVNKDGKFYVILHAVVCGDYDD